MARRPEGWKLRRDPRTGIWRVRFTHEGQRIERSTRTTDRGAAQAAAADIFARVTQGDARRRTERAAPLRLLVADWLEGREAEVSAGHMRSMTMHWREHLLPHFKRLEGITTLSAQAYTRQRLGEVTRSTVLKELSTLRQFTRWCADTGILPADVDIRPPPRRATGTPHAKLGRRGRVELPAETWERILAALPERNRGGTPRAFFVVMYETGLRLGTLQRLEAPGDYRVGDDRLRVRAEVDKARYGRMLPLSERAREALDGVCPKEGLIFGRVDHRGALMAAARAAGVPADKADHVGHHDLRHAFMTQLAESGASIPEMQYLAGHRHAITSSRYVHPAEEAAREALERRGKE